MPTIEVTRRDWNDMVNVYGKQGRGMVAYIGCNTLSQYWSWRTMGHTPINQRTTDEPFPVLDMIVKEAIVIGRVKTSHRWSSQNQPELSDHKYHHSPALPVRSFSL